MSGLGETPRPDSWRSSWELRSPRRGARRRVAVLPQRQAASLGLCTLAQVWREPSGFTRPGCV